MTAGGLATWGVCDDNTGIATKQTPVDGFTGTTYSAGGQVGTAQMEFAVDAWPIQRSEFAPFGEELSSQDFTRNRFKFTGKERDAESGLDYFGARYYSSTMGRWVNPDPTGLEFSDPAGPQTLNLYMYVNNNPLAFTDPNGELTCGSGGAAWSAKNVGVSWISSAAHAIGCAAQDAGSAIASGFGQIGHGLSIAAKAIDSAPDSADGAFKEISNTTTDISNIVDMVAGDGRTRITTMRQ